jgi:prolyl-tRNA synthetase
MTSEEIAQTGCVAGYASPIGVGRRAVVVVDEIVASSPNLVAGANEKGWHLRNVNVGRDYQPDHVCDITAVEGGEACLVCGSPLRTERAIEVGNIFKLGTKYSGAFGANYLSEDGTQRPVVMGSYGIGVGRLFACIAEEHRDERGLVWPTSVAPFAVHICVIGEDDAVSAADKLSASLGAAGVEVLVDDRGERAGVQFADAELIGCPVQLTVSKRSLAAGGVEAKLRRAESGAGETVARADIVDWVRASLGHT